MRKHLDRIDDLHAMHDEFNKEVFGNKLMSITILMKRNNHKDGWYEYRTGKGQAGWSPIKDELPFACIVISDGCWKEDSVEGTMLHEMIHQYQAEVLGRATTHDAIFKSMARKLEKKYGYSVRTK